jgi:hypothetical protein
MTGVTNLAFTVSVSGSDRRRTSGVHGARRVRVREIRGEYFLGFLQADTFCSTEMTFVRDWYETGESASSDAQVRNSSDAQHTDDALVTCTY